MSGGILKGNLQNKDGCRVARRKKRKKAKIYELQLLVGAVIVLFGGVSLQGQRFEQ